MKGKLTKAVIIAFSVVIFVLPVFRGKVIDRAPAAYGNGTGLPNSGENGAEDHPDPCPCLLF